MDALTKSHFLSLYCIVLADGVVDAREIATLYRIGTEQFGVSEAEITEAVRDSGTSFLLPENLEDKVRFLYNMALIADADGVIDDSEIALMKRYAGKMGFEDTEAVVACLTAEMKKGTPVESVLQSLN